MFGAAKILPEAREGWHLGTAWESTLNGLKMVLKAFSSPPFRVVLGRPHDKNKVLAGRANFSLREAQAEADSKDRNTDQQFPRYEIVNIKKMRC